jgi:hypothetical protein
MMLPSFTEPIGQLFIAILKYSQHDFAIAYQHFNIKCHMALNYLSTVNLQLVQNSSQQ